TLFRSHPLKPATAHPAAVFSCAQNCNVPPDLPAQRLYITPTLIFSYARKHEGLTQYGLITRPRFCLAVSLPRVPGVKVALSLDTGAPPAQSPGRAAGVLAGMPIGNLRLLVYTRV